MARRGVPLWPTLLVVLAVPVLLGFGVWQLQRAAWKEALLAELAANADAPVTTIAVGDDPERFQFRTVRLEVGCDPPPAQVRAGRNLDGRNGYAVLVPCGWSDPAEYGEGKLLLNIGWGPRPDSWTAAAAGWPPATLHMVEGVLVKRSGFPEWMLVATAPTPPLLASAPPAPDTISNNHRSYAIQWFSFAAILATIYALYLRRWRRAGALAPAAGAD